MSEKTSGCLSKGCCLGCTGCAGLIALIVIVISAGIYSFFSNPLVIPDKVFLTENCAGYINLAANPDNKAAINLLQKFVADIAKENPEHAEALKNIDAKTLEKFLPMSGTLALYPAQERVKPVICLRLNTLGFLTKFMGWFFQFAEKKHSEKPSSVHVSVSEHQTQDMRYTCYSVGKWKYICEFETDAELRPNVAFLDNNILITYNRDDMIWAIEHIEKSISENKTYKNPEIEKILDSFPADSFGKGAIIQKEGFAFEKVFPFIVNMLAGPPKEQSPPPFDVSATASAISKVEVKAVPENELILVNFDFFSDSAPIKEQLKTFFDNVKGHTEENTDNKTAIDIFKSEIQEDRISLSTIIHYSK